MLLRLYFYFLAFTISSVLLIKFSFCSTISGKLASLKQTILALDDWSLNQVLFFPLIGILLAIKLSSVIAAFALISLVLTVIPSAIIVCFLIPLKIQRTVNFNSAMYYD